jgi:hypothetical protein
LRLGLGKRPPLGHLADQGFQLRHVAGHLSRP